MSNDSAEILLSENIFASPSFSEDVRLAVEAWVSTPKPDCLLVSVVYVEDQCQCHCSIEENV